MRSSTSSQSSFSMSSTAHPHAVVALFFPANAVPDAFIASIPRKVNDPAVDGTADLDLSDTLDGADVLIEFSPSSSGAALPSPVVSSPVTSQPGAGRVTVTATVRGSTVSAFVLEMTQVTCAANDPAVPAAWTPELSAFVLDCVLGPCAVLYDPHRRALTSNAIFALRRAFWLMDRDKNGFLGRAEAAAWPQALLRPDLPADGMDEAAFLEHSALLLAAGHHRAVWEVLKAQHISPKTALPYNTFDLASVKVDDAAQLYLSHVGIQFFVSVYQLDRFPKLDDMWRLVHGGCPWRAIASLPSTHVPLDQFMEAWKLMAWLHRDAVVKCARTWGFRGEPQQLFVKRKCRALRSNDESLPNAVKVLVVGAPHCGRGSLVDTLCARDTDEMERSTGGASGTSSARSLGGGDGSAPQAPEGGASPRGNLTTIAPLSAMCVRTVTVADEHSKQPVTLIYVKLPEADTSRVIITAALQKQFDCVVLCGAGCDPYSASYWMERYNLAMALKPARLPFIVVGTKCDVPAAAKAGDDGPTDGFCRSAKLAWPPLYTSSVVDPGDAPCGVPNEVAQLNDLVVWVTQQPERALAPAGISAARYARRILLVLGGLVAVTAGVRALLKLIWPRGNTAAAIVGKK